MKWQAVRKQYKTYCTKWLCCIAMSRRRSQSQPFADSSLHSQTSFFQERRIVGRIRIHDGAVCSVRNEKRHNSWLLIFAGLLDHGQNRPGVEPAPARWECSKYYNDLLDQVNGSITLSAWLNTCKHLWSLPSANHIRDRPLPHVFGSF